MWDVVKIIGAIVVIVLLFEALDIAEILKRRLRGGLSRRELEQRLNGLESRVGELEKKSRPADTP